MKTLCRAKNVRTGAYLFVANQEGESFAQRELHYAKSQETTRYIKERINGVPRPMNNASLIIIYVYICKRR